MTHKEITKLMGLLTEIEVVSTDSKVQAVTGAAKAILDPHLEKQPKPNSRNWRWWEPTAASSR